MTVRVNLDALPEAGAGGHPLVLQYRIPNVARIHATFRSDTKGSARDHLLSHLARVQARGFTLRDLKAKEAHR